MKVSELKGNNERMKYPDCGVLKSSDRTNKL